MKKYKTEIVLFIVFIAIIATFFIIDFFRKRLTLGKKMYIFKNASTAAFINGLHPTVKNNFADFITEIESHLNGDLIVTITSGTRDSAKQAAQGNGVNLSLHNFGFAIDINVNGKDDKGATVALRMASPAKDWQFIVNIAKRHGLGWGGKFQSGIYAGKGDNVHFNFTKQRTEAAMMADIRKSGKDSNGFVIV